jgi:hypothetical protein
VGTRRRWRNPRNFSLRYVRFWRSSNAGRYPRPTVVVQPQEWDSRQDHHTGPLQ